MTEERVRRRSWDLFSSVMSILGVSAPVICFWMINSYVDQRIQRHNTDPLAHSIIREKIPTEEQYKEIIRVHEEILRELSETNQRLARIEGRLEMHR